MAAQYFPSDERKELSTRNFKSGGLEGGHRGKRGPIYGEGRRVDFGGWAHVEYMDVILYSCTPDIYIKLLIKVVPKNSIKKEKKTVSWWTYLSGIKGRSKFSGEQNKEFVTIGPTPKEWLEEFF